MFHGLYEQVVHFASEGALDAEIKRAKVEFIERTGDIFESDETFERRIGGFLEWYTLDRLTTSGGRPVDLFVAQRQGENVDPQELERLSGLLRTHLSLFEFRKAKNEQLMLIDLLNPDKKGAKVEVYERRKPAGLEAGDILEARLVPYEGKLMLSEAVMVLPREGRKVISTVAKTYRTSRTASMPRVSFVHRIAYFANRCERYKHVSAARIFADLEGSAFTEKPPTFLRAAAQ
ncbi:MAG: hypothetical protein H7Z43_05675 [Clostridia bacterium]|nr:hypothetical protein [Deltaproteobacteria bacterium]